MFFSQSQTYILYLFFPLPKPDAEFLMGCMFPIFSEPGSLKRQKESKIVNFLQDFIQNIEDEGDAIALKFYEPICVFEYYCYVFIFSMIMTD